MFSTQWVPRDVVLQANDRPTVVRAQVPLPYQEGKFAQYVGVVIVTVLVAISLFFPPALLLNIPILVFRSFMKQLIGLKQKRVRLSEFSCPKCMALNSSAEHNGRFPLYINCTHCTQQIRVELAEALLNTPAVLPTNPAANRAIQLG